MDKNNESFLVFNTFYRRLDTVFFSHEKKRIAVGFEIPSEGPNAIPRFDYFTYTKRYLIFFGGNDVYYMQEGNTIRLNLTRELDNGQGGLKSIYGGGFNRLFQAASLEGDCFYLIANDHVSGEFSIVKYDFQKFQELPFKFDLGKLKDHRIFYTDGSLILENAYNPFMTASDSVIVVSYPFNNEINIFGIDDLKQSELAYESNLFKTIKDLPSKNSSFDIMSDFFDAKSSWNQDVTYGPVYSLDEKLMYRMVFESQNGSPRKFLELFNNSFEKVGEFDLTAIQPDLKWFHITVEGKILIQSSKDPNEDIFKYYLISVDPI